MHWKAGLKVSQGSAFAARTGDTTIQLDTSVASSAVSAIYVGQTVWVGAAASKKMYESQGIPRTYGSNVAWTNLHVRSQMFRVAAINAATRTVTIDTPLEFDLPANSTSDGSTALDGGVYYSKVMPATPVMGVGFESLGITLKLAGLPKLGGGTYSFTAADAVNNYANLAPEYALHGIIFKWAVDCWTRDVRTDMTGSHPIVSENAKNLQIQDCSLVGSWNKGKGGNGYLRGSRLWDSLIARNTLRPLRHLTMQWSSSGNVVMGNDLDCDINLHGGWERRNLIERNRQAVPWNHSSGNFTINGGDEGGGVETGTWFPIWWGTGPKAGKWACATGPQNVFFANIMTKQLVSGGPFLDYAPYYAGDGSLSHRIVQFGYDRTSTNGSSYQFLTDATGAMLDDWGGNETADYATAPRLGVNALRTDPGDSLFLNLGTPPAAIIPAMTIQPGNVTVTAPATATFSVAVSGSPTPTYQWSSAPSGSSTFTAISGATSASYTTDATTIGMSGTQYRCVATNSAGSATSNNATLTVSAPAGGVNGAGDLNGDKVVNLSDLILVRTNFGKRSTDAGWDARADTNGDNVVNLQDLITVRSNFGRTYP